MQEMWAFCEKFPIIKILPPFQLPVFILQISIGYATLALCLDYPCKIFDY